MKHHLQYTDRPTLHSRLQSLFGSRSLVCGLSFGFARMCVAHRANKGERGGNFGAMAREFCLFAFGAVFPRGHDGPTRTPGCGSGSRTLIEKLLLRVRRTVRAGPGSALQTPRRGAGHEHTAVRAGARRTARAQLGLRRRVAECIPLRLRAGTCVWGERGGGGWSGVQPLSPAG